jgi:hypothetical protein
MKWCLRIVLAFLVLSSLVARILARARTQARRKSLQGGMHSVRRTRGHLTLVVGARSEPRPKVRQN